jgi:hypothetical protein
MNYSFRVDQDPDSISIMHSLTKAPTASKPTDQWDYANRAKRIAHNSELRLIDIRRSCA